MKIRIHILIIAFVLGAFWSWAQGDGNYLPYEMPGHTAVKYNTYLMHPTFPIFSKNESTNCNTFVTYINTVSID